MVARSALFTALDGSGNGTSPTDGRLVLGSLYGFGGGLVAGATWSTSSSNMQLTVSAAVWKVPDPTNSSAIFLAPADTTTLTLAAGPASGSRIDMVWVKANNPENGDADSRVTYGIAQGTASTGTPPVPSVPAGAMAVMKVTVPTGASNSAACTLANVFWSIVAPPSLVHYSSDVSTFPAGQHVGQRLYCVPTGLDWRWLAAGRWQPWDSAWMSYSPTYSGVTLAGGGYYSVGKYRWEAGRVHVQIAFGLGAGDAFTGGVVVSVPEPVWLDGYNTSMPLSRLQGFTTVVQASNGRVFDGPVFAHAAGGDSHVNLGTVVANDTFAYQTTVANAQPSDNSQYTQVFVDCTYDSNYWKIW